MTSKATTDLTSAILSSTLTTLALYPVERLKIEMQLDKLEDDPLKSARKILSSYGVLGFYQGLKSLLIGNAMAYGIYFVVYEHLKRFFIKDGASMIPIIYCSGLAGIAGSLATNPFYVIQTRQAKFNTAFMTAFNDIVRNEGAISLWKGMLASLILVSNPIIQFVVYEWLKKMLMKGRAAALSSHLVFLLGALSKIVATLVTYPYTLLRTRQQASASKQEGLLKICKEVVAKQHLVGLFKGFTPKLLQTTLNAALIMMIYQKMQALFLKFHK